MSQSLTTQSRTVAVSPHPPAVTTLSTDQSPATAVECPECGGRVDVDAGSGERICQDCGLVVAADRLDRGPEWRCFGDEEGQHNTVRTSGARDRTHHDYALQTQLGEIPDSLSGRRKAVYRRLRTQQKRGQFASKTERTLADIFGQIKRIGGTLELGRPHVERACKLTRQFNDEFGFSGQDSDAVAGGAVHAAIREAGLPLTVDEVAALTHADVDAIKTVYGKISVHLDLSAPIRSPLDWLPPLVDDLSLSEPATRRATQLAQMADNHPTTFAGRSPSIIAAACVWAATVDADDVDRRPQQTVARAGDASAVALRNNAELLESVVPGLDVCTKTN